MLAETLTFHSYNITLKREKLGCLGGSVVERLPSAQGVNEGSWDRVPYQAPGKKSASPSTYVSASLSVSLVSK